MTQPRILDIAAGDRGNCRRLTLDGQGAETCRVSRRTITGFPLVSL